MKRYILWIASIFVCQFAMAQSPKEISQLADDLMKPNANQTFSINATGKIFTKKKGLVEGNVEFVPSTKPNGMGIAYLYTENSMKPIKFYASDVDSILIDDVKWLPIEVKIDMQSYTTFGVALNSSMNDKMKMFKIYRLNESSADEIRKFGGAKYSLDKIFVTQFTDDKKAWPIGGVSLSPFHKYMSKATKDCKSLSEKIESKEEGYTFKAIELGKLLDKTNDSFDVIYKIMDEYNSCQ